VLPFRWGFFASGTGADEDTSDGRFEGTTLGGKARSFCLSETGFWRAALDPKPEGMGLAEFPFIVGTIDAGWLGAGLTGGVLDFSANVLILSDFSFLIFGFGIGGGTSIGADSNVLASYFSSAVFPVLPRRTYIDQESPISCIAYDSPPSLIAPLQCPGISNDEQRALGSRQGNVHTPSILQETNGGRWSRSDGGEDDDVFLLSLETIDSIESIISFHQTQFMIYLLDLLEDILSVRAGECTF
jgi:hypothetical protein